jgi:hypothetical protein
MRWLPSVKDKVFSGGIAGDIGNMSLRSHS